MSKTKPTETSPTLTALPTIAPQCEGAQHSLGTYGHDAGPARFKVISKCVCGFSDARLLCQGRVDDMLRRTGVTCEQCGVAFEADEFLQIEPIAKTREVPPALSLVGIDDSEILREFAVHQRARGFSEATITNRASMLNSLIQASGKSLQTVTVDAILAYLGREGIKASSRRTNRTAFRAFFVFAEEHRYRTDNPAKDLPSVRVPKAKPRPFTVEQIDAMLESGAYRKTRAMILLGYYQGFRVSSIARVHGHDIDLQGSTIRTVGKGSKDRMLPLHPMVAELATLMPADDWWFPARDGSGGHILASSVTNLITIAKKRAGIRDPKLTPHSLRHSFATHLMDGGVDIRVIQELMMHDDLGSTQVYSGVSDLLARQGISALSSREIPRTTGRRSHGPLAGVE